MSVVSLNQRCAGPFPIGIKELFSVGNTFSMVTMSASHDAYFSIGSLRSFQLFHLSAGWLANLSDRPLSYYLESVTT